MAAESVTDRALGAQSVRVPVQLTGYGPVGQVGASVQIPAFHKAELFEGLASAPVLTPPLHPTHLVRIVKAKAIRQRTATTCPSAQWMEVGGLGYLSVPVLLPVGWDFRCHSGDVTAPPPNMAVVHVLEKDVKPGSVQPKFIVQWMACGLSGPSGICVNSRVGGTSAARRPLAAIYDRAIVSIELITDPSAAETT